MTFIQRAGIEAALPHVSKLRVVQSIPIQKHSSRACVSERMSQRVGLARLESQLDGRDSTSGNSPVERVRKARGICAGAPDKRAVGVAAENELPGVAALRNMMRNVGDHHARQACHLDKLSDAGGRCASIGVPWGDDFPDWEGELGVSPDPQFSQPGDRLPTGRPEERQCTSRRKPVPLQSEKSPETASQLYLSPDRLPS